MLIIVNFIQNRDIQYRPMLALLSFCKEVAFNGQSPLNPLCHYD